MRNAVMTLRMHAKRARTVLVQVCVLLVLALVPIAGRSATTQIVLLGTGTPEWDPDRSGPATAIIVNGTPYLIDFGAGVVRRAGAAYRKGIEALLPTNLGVVFLTHRHTDHTVGYADLIFTPVQAGGPRKQPLDVYGPKGIVEMTEHVLKGFVVGPNTAQANTNRFRVNAHEITTGVVYKDDNVTVKAFYVAHGNIEAFGYRFETPDRTIVISGDTTPTQSVIDNCQGCDVLIHEAYSMKTYNAVSAEAQANRQRLHTSTLQLAELAGKAKPGLLILYHRSNLGGVLPPVPNPEAAFLEEIRASYAGKVVIGHDLDIY